MSGPHCFDFKNTLWTSKIPGPSVAGVYSTNSSPCSMSRLEVNHPPIHGVETGASKSPRCTTLVLSSHGSLVLSTSVGHTHVARVPLCST